MNRLLKVNWNDQVNDLIDGLQRISDTELDNQLIPYVLADFAENSGTGHINLSSGEEIGTFENTYWDQSLSEGDSIEHHTILFDFDDGTDEGWTFDATNFEVKDNRSNSGDYSIGIEDGSAPELLASHSPDDLSGGKQIDRFSFWWQENSSNSGGGAMLLDSSGNEVIGVATDNPEINIDDADGFVQVSGGGSYDAWYRFMIDFDWSAGTATVSVHDTNGLIEAWMDRPLKNNTDIASIELRGQNGEAWSSDACYMWFDDITFEYTELREYNTVTTPLYQNRNAIGSLSFDGVDDYVEYENPVSFTSSEPWTYEHYIYWNGETEENFVFYAGRISTSQGFLLRRSDNNEFAFRDENLDYHVFGDSNSIIGKWTRLSWVADGSGTLTLYVDGDLIDAISGVNTEINFESMGRGYSTDAYKLDGKATDDRIWDHARTQSEIKANMNNRLTGNETGLVGYWPLAGDAKDYTSNGNDGTLQNGPTWVDDNPGIVPRHYLAYEGGSLSFDGVDDEVTTPLAPGFSPSDSFLFEGWMYFQSNPGVDTGLIAVDSFDGAYGLYRDADDSIEFGVRDSDGAGLARTTVFASEFPLNAWIHVAGYWEAGASTAHLYVDEVQRSNTNTDVDTGLSGAEVGINVQENLSASSNYGLQDMMMSEARIWDVTGLTKSQVEQQIQDNMNKRLNGDEDGLVGYWRLAGSAYDYSSNDNHGTLVNGPTWVNDSPFTPGGDLRVLSRKNLRDSIIQRAVDEMVNNEGVGCFRIFEGTSLPGDVTGEWEKVGEYADDETVNSTTTFTLWKKIDTNLSEITDKPLRYSGELEGLQRMTGDEVRLLSELVREYILTTGIGEYVLAESAPGTGTWMAVGDEIPDERYDVADETHYHTYSGARNYSGNYTSNYDNNYTSNYSQNYSRNFNANYSANYTGNFGNSKSGYYSAYYSSNYSSSFTGNYSSNYATNYSSNYSSTYAGSRKYSGSYAGTTTESTIQSTKTTKTYRLWVRTS